MREHALTSVVGKWAKLANTGRCDLTVDAGVIPSEPPRPFVIEEGDSPPETTTDREKRRS